MLRDDASEYSSQPKSAQTRPLAAAAFEGLPPELLPLDGRDRDGAAIYKAYLHGRNVPERLWGLWRLGFCLEGSYAGRVIVPSFDELGVPNFFCARAIAPWMKPPYLLPDASKDVVSNGHMIDWRLPVCLVEGAFDAIAIGPQAIPLWGVAIGSKQLLTLVKKSPPVVYVCLDADATTAANRLASRLLRYGIKTGVVRLPCKDPAMCGPSGMKLAISRTEILTCEIEALMLEIR